MKKCTNHDMQPFGTVELRIVNLEQENGMPVRSEWTGDIVACNCCVCSTCGYIELTELTGQVHA